MVSHGSGEFRRSECFCVGLESRHPGVRWPVYASKGKSPTLDRMEGALSGPTEVDSMVSNLAPLAPMGRLEWRIICVPPDGDQNSKKDVAGKA